ncbi:MAG: alpha/beta hydrolase [Candidatus Sungbacteria bacterium]|nr:alpha/beta hydrolase [Candidatus Sungbacteria bacterium]
MKMIVQNLAIEYRDEGSGPVLLFLHGWKDSLHTFDLLVPLLSADYRIIRLDLPGFGESEAPRTAWHVDDYAECVAECIKKLGINVGVIVGHSLGGRIVLKGIAANILDAQKIILIASAGIAERNTFRILFFRVLAKIGRLATAVPPFGFFRELLRKRLYGGLESDYLSAGPLKETFLNIINEDLSASAKMVTKPALLIWGSEDTQTPLQDGKRLATFIPGAALEVIPGSGHFVHQEKPAEVAGLIRKFAS